MSVHSLVWERSPGCAAADGQVDPGSRFGDVVAFLVPALLVVDFSVVGNLFLSEIVLVAALPFLLDVARRRGVRRISKTFVLLGLVWLIGQIETDLYRATPFADYSRGWSKVIFLILNFAALSLLVDGRWRRVFSFAAGIVTGQILQFYFNPDVFAAGNPWKFGLGPPLTLAGVLLASRPSIFRRHPLPSAILLGLSVVNLAQDFRSLAGVCFVSSIYVFGAGRKATQEDVSVRRIALVAVATMVGSLAFVSAYSHAASGGALGAKAQAKYLRQENSLGVLIGGRPEILASLRAIRDAPILGHGSWAKDPKYGVELEKELRAAGATTSGTATPNGLIPAHSHLFGAWVDSGILGVVFWLWVIWLIAAVLMRLPRLADHRTPLVAFLAVSLTWDILFSPFGAERRLLVPFYVLVLLLARAASRGAIREGTAA